MTAAKDLLIGGKTVAEAMTAIGMVDYAYFTKAFTKTIGTSPLQIKRDNCPENREHLSP
jgi:AraC-like DNA-binding protein